MIKENNNLIKIDLDDIKDGVVIVPKGIVDIGSDVLSDLYKNSVTTLWLPSTVKFLSYACFKKCENLENVFFYDTKQDIDDFYLGKNDIDYLSTYNNLEKIEKSVFSFTKIRHFKIAPRLKIIDNNCFFKSALEKLEFDENSILKKFNTSVIDGCNNLTDLILPSSIKLLEISAGVGCDNLKRIKLMNLPTVEGSFLNTNKGLNNPTILECDELRSFGNIKLKSIYRIDKKFDMLSVNYLFNKAIYSYVKDGKTTNCYVINKDHFHFGSDNVEQLIRKGHILNFYMFEKLIRELNYKRTIPADIVPYFKNEQDIRTYLNISTKNKIYRKTENTCLAYAKMSFMYYNYLKPYVALSFMLGAFSEDVMLRQKASDFIYSTVTNLGSSFLELYNFNKVEIFRNENEQYFQFWRDNYSKLIGLKANGKDWLETDKSAFYNYLNHNFTKLQKLCHNSKTPMTVDYLVNIFMNEEKLVVTPETKDICDELKNYPRTTKKSIEFVYNIKKEMLQNQISQNVFEPVDKFSLHLLFDESKLQDKLTGKTSYGYEFVWLNKYKTKNMTYAIDDRTGCGNLFGLGNGIVAAGMKLDCCQNLRILNEKGEGIARATVYIDKENGKMLYNTFLVYGCTSMLEEEKEKIFRCYQLATIALIKEYEKNFPDMPKINQVNVGESFNGLSSYLRKYYTRKHQDIVGLNFSFYGVEKSDANYNGDWEQEQFMIYNEQELNAIKDCENSLLGIIEK